MRTVYDRATQPTVELFISAEKPSSLTAGDMVFRNTELGLERIGEVAAVQGEDNRVRLNIRPEAFQAMNASTFATCWEGPLDAEAAIEALLPPSIQRKVARRIVADWRAQHSLLTSTWGPIAADLASAFTDAIKDDVQASFHRHQDELWEIAQIHGQAVSEAWPEIQARLQPILQAHLNPVLGRLIHEAIADAPKVSIAWQVALGANSKAFQAMLDWLVDYLANMPEADKVEFGRAVRNTMDAARNDPVVLRQLSEMGQRIFEDERLRNVVTEIYRESIADNPRAAEFVRSHVLESPEVREQFFTFIELFGPTARNVAALCLFDENGATRPEIVHLVRSVALRRNVAWVTLSTPNPSAPSIHSRDMLTTRFRGSKP